MSKRFRKPAAKPGELLVKYGQDYGERDLFYCWPDNDAGMRRDSRVVMHAIESLKLLDGKSLREELTARGYDITSLKFSIMKLPEAQTANTIGVD